MPRDYQETPVISVADFVRQVNDILHSGLPSAWVEGEISSWKVWPSGHAYFTLKDRDAILECVMFAPGPRYLRFQPRTGLAVLVHGRPDIYAPRGQFKLVTDRMLPQGEGLLQLQFQQLVESLKAEGLFDDRWKRPVPAVPERIGVVTSVRGAAIRDFFRTLFGRWPAATVVIADTPVQGQGAARRITDAVVSLATHGDVDVIALVRGGGSIEDLWAFNDEHLARAIRSSPVPIVTGIGHETDTTVADLAADLRASTPTQAAVILSRSIADVFDGIHKCRQALSGSMGARIRDSRLRIISAQRELGDPRHLIGSRKEKLAALRKRMELGLNGRMAHASRQLSLTRTRLEQAEPAQRISRQNRKVELIREQLTRRTLEILADRRNRFVELPARLDAMSPLKVLSRGYSVLTTARGNAVREAEGVSPGETLTARLHRGQLTVIVKDRKPERS